MEDLFESVSTFSPENVCRYVVDSVTIIVGTSSLRFVTVSPCVKHEFSRLVSHYLRSVLA